MSPPTRGTRALRLRHGVPGWGSDRLAVEEPLELRLLGETLALTMRTPGEDFDLVVGFLLSEGVIAGAADIRALRVCRTAADGSRNVVEVELGPAATPPAPQDRRRFAVTSACGVCGSATVEQVRRRSRWAVDADPLRLSSALLGGLPDALRLRQAAFERTGGLHAAALVDPAGDLLCVREDVGRHNAVDKVIGWAARHDRLPLRSHLLLVSGRASFELVQKALLAGIPALAAVSAPSSLAVELARSAGMTLVGFLRGATMNVYCGEERVVAEPALPAG